MALNPNISLQVQVPEFLGPADLQAKAANRQSVQQQLQLHQQQSEANQLKIQAERNDQEEERKFKEALARNATPAELLTIAPKAASLHLKGLIDRQKVEIDNHKQKIALVANSLGSVKYGPEAERPARYSAWRAGAIQEGLIKPEDAPEQYDPAFVDHNFNAAIEADKQADNNQKILDHAQKVIDAAPKTAKEWTDLTLSQVSTAQSQADLDQIRQTLTGLGVPKQVLQMVPAMWSETAMQQVQQRALTPEQRQQAADHKATREQQGKPNTAAELAMIVSDPSKPQADRDVAAAALKVLEKHAIAGRPVTNVFNPPPNVGRNGPVTENDVPEKMRGQVKAIAEYRSPMPSMGRNNPFSQELSYWVNQVNPAYDGTQFSTRNKVQAAYSPSGDQGKNIISINTAIGHLGTLYDAAADLKNDSFRGYNSFANWLSRQSGKDTVKPFAIARNAVAEELGRAFKGGVATQGEVQAWEKEINEADSPQQLRTSIKTITELIAGRLAPLEQAYKDSMGHEPNNPIVHEKSRKVLEKISGSGGAKSTDAQATHRFNPATGKVEVIKK